MSPDPNDVGASATHAVPSQNQVERQFRRAQLFVPEVLVQARVDLRDTTIAFHPKRNGARTQPSNRRGACVCDSLAFAELTLRSR
jgi:hypothetical protein